MSFVPYRSDWFYSVVDIPNLTDLQKEFTDLFWKITENKVPEGAAFFQVFLQCLEYPESLTRLIKHYQLADDRWCFVNFSVLNNGAKFGGVHYDYYLSGSKRYCALNVPLINCENSYNVWYQGDPDPTAVVKSVNYQGNVNSVILNQDTNSDGLESDETRWVTGEAIELIRVECTKPMLVHVGRAHQPEVHHNDLRVMLSLRFRPELSDEEFERITQKSNLT